MGRLLLLLVTIAPLAGCVSTETSEFFRERVEVTSDDLDETPPEDAIERVPLDLEITGYEGDRAPLLDALVHGLESDPGLALGRVDYRGELASRAQALRSLAPIARPSSTLARLSCEPRFSASAWNGLIAFPGMLPFLPIWLGYGWDMELSVEWTIFVDGKLAARGRRSIEVSFREKNARRSAVFHLWPSTGFLGAQFVFGLVLAPTFLFYDAEATTPLLVQALEPRLGRTIAAALRRGLAPSTLLVAAH